MAKEIPGTLRITCQHLRHKMMYINADYGVPGLVDTDSDTRVYVCKQTQDSLGPDNQPVSFGDCTPSRSCYCGKAQA